jgi:hypothetical protein
VLERFVDLNEDAASSANYSSQTPDPLGGVVALLGCAGSNSELLLAVLKTLKILSRKYDNRVRLGSLICDDLVSVLCASEGGALAVAAEAANVVLNICYEKENVTRIMAAGGVTPLLNLLARPQADLQANAAGAIQSICFQKEGRSAVREGGAIPALMPLLSSDSLRVQTRAVGAIHNLSSEPEAIRIIRKLRGIAPLVALLRAPSAAVCGSAAGALQNLSREEQSRQEIHQLGAVMPLIDLLLGEDVQSQVWHSPLRDSRTRRRPCRHALSLCEMNHHHFPPPKPPPPFRVVAGLRGRGAAQCVGTGAGARGGAEPKAGGAQEAADAWADRRFASQLPQRGAGLKCARGQLNLVLLADWRLAMVLWYRCPTGAKKQKSVSDRVEPLPPDARYAVVAGGAGLRRRPAGAVVAAGARTHDGCAALDLG